MANPITPLLIFNLALVSSFWVVAPAEAKPLPQSDRGFVMPSKNIYCLIIEQEQKINNSLRCEIVSNLNPMPPRPADGSCQDLDWGYGLILRTIGKPNVLCAGDTIRADYPTLNYGRTWKRGGFTCKAATEGLTCTNSRGRGFFLNRDRWQIF